MEAVPTKPAAHGNAQPTKSPIATPVAGDQLPKLHSHVRGAAQKTVLSPVLPSKRDALMVDTASNVGLRS